MLCLLCEGIKAVGGEFWVDTIVKLNVSADADLLKQHERVDFG